MAISIDIDGTEEDNHLLSCLVHSYCKQVIDVSSVVCVKLKMVSFSKSTKPKLAYYWVWKFCAGQNWIPPWPLGCKCSKQWWDTYPYNRDFIVAHYDVLKAEKNKKSSRIFFKSLSLHKGQLSSGANQNNWLILLTTFQQEKVEERCRGRWWKILTSIIMLKYKDMTIDHWFIPLILAVILSPCARSMHTF